jgi:hypothetical protein
MSVVLEVQQIFYDVWFKMVYHEMQKADIVLLSRRPEKCHELGVLLCPGHGCHERSREADGW